MGHTLGLKTPIHWMVFRYAEVHRWSTNIFLVVDYAIQVDTILCNLPARKGRRQPLGRVRTPIAEKIPVYMVIFLRRAYDTRQNVEEVN